ncbi:hypothetical protein GW17_00059762 [Ensete ventricosum]|nr:hypothetical protein GW17_00059762 [Ensete ventricosum]
MSFRSYLKWIYINRSNARHAMISWSIFLLLSIFIFTATHFILFYAPTRHVYDVTIQLSLTSTSNLSYLCLSVFVHATTFVASSTK